MNWTKEILKKHLEHLRSQKYPNIQWPQRVVDQLWEEQGFKNITQEEMIYACDKILLYPNLFGPDPIRIIRKFIQEHKKKYPIPRPAVVSDSPLPTLRREEAQDWAKCVTLALKLRNENRFNYHKWSKRFFERVDTAEDVTAVIKKELRDMQNFADGKPKQEEEPY